MNQTNHEKIALTQVFHAIDRRLERRQIQWESFQVKVCGRLVELRFESADMCRPAMQSLQGVISMDKGEPDAVFSYWRDDCKGYLPAEKMDCSTVWESRDATGFLRVSAYQNLLSGCDIVRRRLYLAKPESETADYSVYGHTLVGLFSRWASISDLILLHAAAVGTQGKGVLVVGQGGSGKSTFSVSCMTAGMDFVSDDYTLVSASGPLRAMPLYTNVAVNPDMYARLPALGAPSVPPDETWCNGKIQVAVPREKFTASLDIKAIIMPVIGPDEGDPAIAPAVSDAAIVQMLRTSAVQVGRGREPQLIRQMAERLAGLPVYEMRMSRDLKKNPAFLREFIEKEF